MLHPLQRALPSIKSTGINASPLRNVLFLQSGQFILYSWDSFLDLSNESPLSRLVSLWRCSVQNFHKSKQQTPQIEYNT
ncbi:hypothetical protein T4A_7515 [Trichinella pseudospiralis]|uniref:Uncharacterized protein n=1 Tax=Trichinella pseudospiralis TaxID=6337 RepID=A0A0V1DQF3_TRIPS|nr:hypothetical protein T4A_7515 [Trichinella pseudospiralis]KRZ20080.1 hypothetical protein T4C_10916 [Trichinella pseudospiralis]